MKILGIESSCDETACAVVEDGRRILSSAVASQVEEHKLYGGVVPEIASRRHAEAISGLCACALKDAGCTMDDIGGIAVTYGPGLIGALLCGVSFAKGLALATDKPLIPVNHLKGHVATNYLTTPDLTPPFLCLIVSGGHSHIVEVKSYTEYRVVGRTRDDAAGEAFDKTARVLGFPYPGGVYVDRAAAQGDPAAFRLPHPSVDGGPYDFSFSGLKTAVINLVHTMEQRGEPFRREDVAASFTATVCDLLCGRTLAAAKALGYRTVCVAGGVSANSHLRGEMQRRCNREGIRLYLPETSLCGDNAAMIASQGFFELQAGNTAGPDLNGFASLRLENCKIC